ncbi:MAG: 30S ribosomal protein S1 [Deltaproteobacteria bacterium]|nr:30S ribosomal protein S1 [Deltaproteobacteria bacterium]
MSADEKRSQGSSGGGDSFAELFEKSVAAESIRPGEVVTGTVVAVDGDEVIIDIGYKSEGRVPVFQFTDDGGKVIVQPGHKIRVMVEDLEDQGGFVRLSKEKADRRRIWDEIQEAFEKNLVVEGRITGRVKGGLQVDIGVKAFLPQSQVDLHKVRNLDPYLNSKESLRFKIIKCNKARNNVVVSRRDVLEVEREVERNQTLKTLEVGSTITGKVKNLTDYGAFVDLGGIDGLLHITDMSYGRLNNPAERVKVNEDVTVKVLRIDHETDRDGKDRYKVALGLKQLEPDPWSDVDYRFPIGTKVKGKVVSVVDYGAFVEIVEGVEGLVHFSEMTWSKKAKHQHPSKFIKVGAEVEAVILSIDKNSRRISLGMKQLLKNPWEELATTHPVGSIIEGKVKSITDFGIFVELNDEVDGLVHVSDISWTKKVKNPAEMFTKDEVIKAKIQSIDVDNEKVSLSIKHLESDPWGDFKSQYRRGSIIEGVVKSIADFGAFVEIVEGVEGLIRTNEISTEPVRNAGEVVKIGDKIRAEITSIDDNERKVGLSVRQMEMNATKADIKKFIETQGKARASLGDILADRIAEKAAASQPATEAAAAEPEASGSGKESKE